jgi:hypothetical protein
VLALLAGMALAVPAAARGQCAQCGVAPAARAPLSHQLASLGANAALGGLTAGLMQAWRGGDFAAGFARGAFGGAVTWSGKRLVTERFDGAGFLGRQVAAVGDAFVRNAADGIPLLDRLYFPVYIVRFEVRPRATERRVQPRLDVVSAGWTIYSIVEPELTFDAARSLSAGALVFHTEGKLMETGVDGITASGRSIGSLIFLAEHAQQGDDARAATFAHERVHALQFDQSLIQWAGPLEEWAMRRMGAPGLARWLDLNLASHLLGLMMPPVDYEDRPWEIEARWLVP